MSPLHNGLDEDDFAFWCFTLDGGDDPDEAENSADEEDDAYWRDVAAAERKSAEDASEEDAAGDDSSSAEENVPDESAADVSAAEENVAEEASANKSPAGDNPADENPANGSPAEEAADEAAAPADDASADKTAEADTADTADFVPAENSIGVSSHDRQFTFRAQAVFSAYSSFHRLLANLRFVLPVLAVAILFLHMTPIPSKYVWAASVICLVAGIIAHILFVLLRKPWQVNVAETTLTFRPEYFELSFPISCAGEFGLAGTLPDSADPAREKAFWQENERLLLRLPPANLLDQAYHTDDRTTVLTFDIDFADRMLSLRIPDAALSREDRSELEAEVFNRAGRSLRAVKD